jgi:ribosome recycling factor
MQYNFTNLKASLKKVEEFLGKEYSQLSTGRASPMVLDSVSVESYGAMQSIKNIASISIEDPKTLRIAPWDKSQIKGIEKAILTADLGLSVATDEAGIRVIFPQLTTETRQKLVKVLKDKLEEARITARRERGDVWEEIQNLEKEGKMTEDERSRAKDELQKVVDEANKNLEALFEKKEKEVVG